MFLSKFYGKLGAFLPMIITFFGVIIYATLDPKVKLSWQLIV